MHLYEASQATSQISGRTDIAPLVLLGLHSPFSITGLLIVNLVAAISYPDIRSAADKDHLMRGF